MRLHWPTLSRPLQELQPSRKSYLRAIPSTFFSLKRNFIFDIGKAPSSSERFDSPNPDTTMAALPNGQNAPTGVAEAVLKPSDPVPEDATPVKGIEFDQFAGQSITVEQLLEGYANMGFQ